MRRALAPALLVVVTVSVAVAQTPADGWSGQLQCVLEVRAATGYQDDQTHTWVLSGTPIARSDFRDYPATWTVTGRGARPGTAPLLADSWTRSGSDANASITIFVPVLTKNIRITPGQRVVRAIGGLRATSSSGAYVEDADEWRFQFIEIPDGAGQTSLTGSRTTMRADRVGWREPAGIPVTETCTWNFTKGGGGQISTGVTGASGALPQIAGTSAPPTVPRVAPAATSGVAARAPSAPLALLPRTITLPGFTAEGAPPIQPRTISLAGFTAQGGPTSSVAASLAAPRTFSLAGFIAEGPNPVAPRTVTLTGWTGTGP